MNLKPHPIPLLKNTLQAFFVLLLTILFSSCSGSKSTFRSVEKQLERSPVFEKGFPGLMVYDPENRKVLYEYNSDKYFTPASNTKLFTFYTGLKMLGDSVPALRYTVKNDSLIFKGTGDPSLLNPYLPESRVIPFLKQAEAELFYLPPVVQETFFGPGWAWDDYNDYYSVERSAFPVYGNEVTFTPSELQEKPEAFPALFREALTADTLLQKRIRRDLFTNQFRYPKNFSKEQTVPLKTSAETAIRLLSDTLVRPVQILSINPNITFQKTLYSIPTDSLYKRMLQESDNFIAEQTLLLAANEISDSLRTGIAIKHMKEHFLKDLPDELKWVDGSGLSRYNLTTPRNMVRLLEKIKKEVSQKRLFHLLPAGGRSGTIEKQFKADEPWIFAKTGSLSNNYSLSGYMITKKGELLIFSFMNSNYVVPSAELKEQIEVILRAIRNNN
ncbi:D-alanyl-D-alanine carboxypeptidase/D-alanyl-D-alanine-endopeptidase [Salinimicrobium catena]|nr:D-alanyl-D-alanine carboxypeptidase [Salinimicrobium catena]